MKAWSSRINDMTLVLNTVGVQIELGMSTALKDQPLHCMHSKLMLA